MVSKTHDHVNYDALDRVKLACIDASKKTLDFASDWGIVPDRYLGASANLFQLHLAPFVKDGMGELFLTLVPEGLGTADDARPEDLSSAELTEFWWNIGIKSVAVMTNDAATAGARPLAIGLYLPSSTPETVFTKEFINGFLDGFVEGCRKVGCVYLAGETPQLKTKMIPGKLDIAGAVVAALPAGSDPVNSAALNVGDHIVFIESSGPHENGFTTLRALADKLPAGYREKLPSGQEYWRAINRGSHLYSPLVQRILAEGIAPTNIENVTGHGWLKLMRSRKPLRYRISAVLPETELFSKLEQWLEIDRTELLKIFNCGVGYAIFTKNLAEAQRVVELAGEGDLKAIVAGTVEDASERQVVIEPYDVTLDQGDFLLSK